ncbi:MAG TPA: hypothetical protein DCS07_04095 [Bdellovibrionales bacterium]|nr:hypothetical protein [Bdellovibrionales bacterium]
MHKGLARSRTQRRVVTKLPEASNPIIAIDAKELIRTGLAQTAADFRKLPRADGPLRPGAQIVDEDGGLKVQNIVVEIEEIKTSSTFLGVPIRLERKPKTQVQLRRPPAVIHVAGHSY